MQDTNEGDPAEWKFGKIIECVNRSKMMYRELGIMFSGMKNKTVKTTVQCTNEGDQAQCN